MNALKKARIGITLRNTWPFYIVSAVLVVILINVAFKLTHRTPEYKTLTIFVSGEVIDAKKLKSDMLEKFKEQELKEFSCISSNSNDPTYNSRLTIPGYNSADILIIPTSKLDNLVISDIALELKEPLISSYYQGYSFYQKDSVNYGIKINKDIVKDYMALPSEDCYMILSGKSINTGEYSPEKNKEHNNALVLAKDWGI